MPIADALNGKGFMFETDPVERDDDYDLNEQNFDSMAQSMVSSWTRSDLLKELEQDKDIFGEDTDYTQYYDGETSFEELKQGMEAIEGGHLWIKKIEEFPDAKQLLANDTVLYDYTGFLEHNSEPFASTIVDGKPQLCNLGGDDGVLISGLLLGLLSLRKGERAQILIHPALAFGETGGFPLIPPHSYLYYSVKVHQVWSEGDFDGWRQWERDNYTMIPLSDKIALSHEHKDVANRFLSEDKPKEALVRYKAAIKWLCDTDEIEILKSPECKQLLSILWQNVSITLNKLEMHKSATKAARQSLMFNPTNIKAVYQLARARIALGDHTRALLVLERGERISPKHPGILQLKSQINVNLRNEKEKRDEIMLKMAKGLIY